MKNARALIQAVRISCTAALAVASLLPAFAQTPPTPACSAAEYRQLDFWVGRWQVYPKAAPDHKVADSLIERLYDGCAIRENWMPLKGSAGGSLSAYRASEKGWHQTWLDATGAWVEFKGGWTGNAMVIEGLWPQPGYPNRHVRMSYTRLANGDVEQLGEDSDDQGKTWQPDFDFLYRKAP